MQVFVEVADCGSFTRAAIASGLSQATVSSHVAQLEQHLGTRLFERTTRSVALTAEGTAYYAVCQRVLSELADAESMLRQSSESPRGRLRIDVTVALATRLVVPILAEFFTRYPDITVELHHTPHLSDEKHETFDVLFRWGELKDSDLVAMPISPMRLVLAASPQYLAQRGEPQHPSDLLQHDCIGYVDPLTRRIGEWNFERADARISVPPGGHLSCNEGESRIAAAVAGLGIVMTHVFELRQLIRDNALKVVLPEWVTSPSQFSVAYPRDRYLSKRVRAFIDFVIEKYPPNQVLDIDSVPPVP